MANGSPSGSTGRQWSTAWIKTVERLGLLAHHPTAGRQRTRIKRIEALTSHVQAEIQDQTHGTCHVTLKFVPLAERTWVRLIERLESQLQSNAQQHAMAHPPEQMRVIEELFRETGPFFTELSALLLPERADEILVECSCRPTETKTCPGCDLVYRQIGTMLDEEPILLLRLRGRDWQALQQAFQARRSTDYLNGQSATGVAQNRTSGAERSALAQPGVQPAATGESLERTLAHFWGSRKTLEALHYHIAPPIIELALLRRLGPLPAMLDERAGSATPDHNLDQEMAKIYRQVTVEAQALAYSLDTIDQGENG